MDYLELAQEAAQSLQKEAMSPLPRVRAVRPRHRTELLREQVKEYERVELEVELENAATIAKRGGDASRPASSPSSARSAAARARWTRPKRCASSLATTNSSGTAALGQRPSRRHVWNDGCVWSLLNVALAISGLGLLVAIGTFAFCVWALRRERVRRRRQVSDAMWEWVEGTANKDEVAKLKDAVSDISERLTTLEAEAAPISDDVLDHLFERWTRGLGA